MNEKEGQLTDAYDFEREFDEKISPLLRQVHDECTKLDLPCILAVCYSNDPQEGGSQVGNAVAVNLSGTERTPPTFFVAEAALRGNLGEAIGMAISTGLVGGKIEELSRRSMKGDTEGTVH